MWCDTQQVAGKKGLTGEETHPKKSCRGSKTGQPFISRVNHFAHMTRQEKFKDEITNSKKQTNKQTENTRCNAQIF